MTIPNDYVSERPALNDIELAQYKKDGYIIPDWHFSDDDVNLMRGLVEEIIKLNPDHQQEQFVCPHLPEGATKPMNSSRHRDFLRLATAAGLRTVLKQIIGKDILLWGSQLFCKPAMTGMEIPWHQDGAYWPKGMNAGRVAFLDKSEDSCLNPMDHRLLVITPALYRRWASTRLESLRGPVSYTHLTLPTTPYV